ncbi:MAG TPA: hypothetical protein VFQ20_05275 [Burkholderiaceae bacterium]|nr:hypothetical protein [Burkholderiaceae bacterium]
MLLNTRRWAHVALHPDDEREEQLRLTRRWIEAVTAAQGRVENCIGSLVDAEVSCGNLQEAVRVGERALAELAHARDGWAPMMIRSNVVLALLAMDDAHRARVLMEQVWPAALRFDVVVLFADSIALMAALEGRPRAATLVAGYADAGYAGWSLIRHPNERAARARTEGIVSPVLGAAAFARLLGDGGRLSRGEIERLAFATADCDG